MKPGMSRRTSTGRLPTARSASITTATVASEVSSLRTTSTSGITSAGVKKCVPTKRSRRVTALARALIDRPEVLVAKIAPGAQMASSFAKMPRLSSRFSGTASITRSQSAAASRSGDMRMRAIASASSPAAYTPSWRATLARAGPAPRPPGRSARQAPRGEQRGDAAAHAARADHGQMLEGSIHDGSLPCWRPAARRTRAEPGTVSSVASSRARGQKIFCSIYEHLCVYRISAEDSTKSGGRWTNQLFKRSLHGRFVGGQERCAPSGRPAPKRVNILEPGERL